jgi:hypothetical protein
MACEVLSMNSFRSALEKGAVGAPSAPLMPAKKPSGASEVSGLTSVPVARDAKRTANHRDGDRHRLQTERVRIKVGRKHHDVDLINLSGGGAMIRTDAELDMWQKVQLMLGECDALECAVRWMRGDRVGLEFAHETQIGGDPAKRDAMLLQVIKRSFPDVQSVPTPAVEAKAATPKAKMSAASHRRVAIRHPLIWCGEVHYDHQSIQVRLRNISESGVLADCGMTFPPEAEVLLDLGGAGQHFATVSWSRGDQVGLRFTKPFDISKLAKAKPEVADHRWATPDYLRNCKGDGSAWADDWNPTSLPEIKDSLEGFLKR